MSRQNDLLIMKETKVDADNCFHFFKGFLSGLRVNNVGPEMAGDGIENGRRALEKLQSVTFNINHLIDNLEHDIANTIKPEEE